MQQFVTLKQDYVIQYIVNFILRIDSVTSTQYTHLTDTGW